jgi:hypothetical protein
VRAYSTAGIKRAVLNPELVKRKALHINWLVGWLLHYRIPDDKRVQFPFDVWDLTVA